MTNSSFELSGLPSGLDQIKQKNDLVLKEILDSWTKAAGQMGNVGKDMAASMTERFADIASSGEVINNFLDPTIQIVKGIAETGSASQDAVGGVKAFGSALNAATGVVGLVITAVTTLIDIFQELTKADEAYQALADGAESFRQASESSAAAGQKSIDLLQAQATLTPELVSRLDELNKKSNKSAEEQAEMTGIVAQLNSSYEGLGLTIDGNTGKLNMNAQEILSQTEAMRKQAEEQARQQVYLDVIKKQTEAELERKLAMDKVKDALVDQGKATREQADSLTEADIAALANGESLDKLGGSIGFVYGNLEASLGAFNDYNTVAEDSKAKAEELATQMDAETRSVSANSAAKEKATDIVKQLTDTEAASLIAKQENNKALSEEEQNALDTWKSANQSKYEAMVAANELEKQLYDQKLSYTKDAFSNVQEAMNNAEVLSLEQMISNLHANQAAMEAWTENQKVLSENGLGELVEVFSEMGPQGFAQAQYLVDQIQAGADMSELLSALGYNMGEANTILQTWDNQKIYDSSTDAVDQTAAGISGNTAAIMEARNQIAGIENEMEAAIRDKDFTTVGQGIIDEITNGLIFAKWRLYDQADEIVSTLKGKLRINGKVSVSGNGVNSKVSIDWYDKGGYFNSPQIIGIAERRPEFVGAADDLESFIGKAVNNAFVRIDPALLHDIGSIGGNEAYSGSSVDFHSQITINTQKLTDAEMKRATDYISREFAKTVTGRKVGRLQ